MTDNKGKTVRASASKLQTTIQIPFGSLEFFNQHDTPPPTLFMQGSCIMEFGFAEQRLKITDFETFQQFINSEPVRAARTDKEQVFLAHVKIVDGSGDMLYRFDNKYQDRLVITLSLSNDGDPIGELNFSVSAGGFEIGYPNTTKIDLIAGDDPMNDRRIRLRCVDRESGINVEISGVSLEKRVQAGSIPLYACAFRDLSSLGTELKVMCWYEETRRDD